METFNRAPVKQEPLVAHQADAWEIKEESAESSTDDESKIYQVEEFPYFDDSSIDIKEESIDSDVNIVSDEPRDPSKLCTESLNISDI